MSFDETNSDDFGEAPLPEESNNNRTFMIAVGILSGIILVSLACLAGVWFFTQRSTATTQQTDSANTTATAAAANAIIDQALTATFEAAIKPTTTATLPPTLTPPVAPASPTSTPDPASAVGLAAGTQVAATATVGAAYTQAAIAQLTVVPTTTALAASGFADEYGLPGLVVMALAFVIVILFARRLRIAPETKR